MIVRDARRPPAILCGGTMIRISLAYIYNLATWFEALAALKAGDQVSVHWFSLFFAQSGLENFLNHSVFSKEIRTSRQAAIDLLQSIKQLSEASNPERPIEAHEVSSIQYNYNQWKIIALAEMETLNAHFVTQKRGYDSMALISYAEVIFPPDLSVKVPEAIPDIQQAGKCIAFELPTAAGFHLHRANEMILHRYYDAVANGKERPKNRNIGGYLKTMTDNNMGDQRLLSTLRDLNDLHRNPLIHPDQVLESIDDAIALLDAVHNAAVFMLKTIPAVTK